MTPNDDELRPLSEAGFDLDDEAALGPFDLDGIRAAVDARVGPGGGGGGAPAGAGTVGMGGIAAAALALLVLGGAGVLWLQQPVEAESVALVPVDAHVAITPAASVAPTSPVAPMPAASSLPPEPVAAPAVPSSPVVPSTAPGRPPVSQVTALNSPSKVAEVSEGTSEESVDGTSGPLPEATGTAEAPIAAPRAGDLDAQNEAFARGEAALRQGDHEAAARAFEGYLAQWPDGVFRDDALLSVLDLTLQAQRWREAEVLAKQLEALPSLAARHGEIRKAHAEALIRQDRCDLALRLAESMDRPDANAVKRSCR